ncbi:Protein prenyltransferase [Penicillium taxi]|uniref:Protein prenyltransferase n=1 Tax=Penicillium taxi TaxID=168475 RepID=UPI0025453D09|nr:Protein prenyltransferase [Penicillium taxi]KAJ5907926.1 Protein prenyltransferase [Penicillium taxi]
MTSTPKNVFQELAHIFSSRENNVFEIEIISPSLGASILQDGLAIGITKKALVQAFTVARQLFTKRLVTMSEDDISVNLSQTNIEFGQFPDPVITEIILLFDCEHLTSCNWRKRRLQAAVRKCAIDETQIASTVQMLETELTLLASYQCSPLHRHTKSPTLWSHRLWVLKQLFQLQPVNTESVLKLERAELDIVLRAGVLHPKNYYAFNYMRKLHCVLATIVGGKDSSRNDLAKPLVSPMMDWCLAHPRDISGWVFEEFLLDNVVEPRLHASTVARVLHFARDIGWEGESLWTFIDRAASQFDLESVLDDTLGIEGLPVLTTEKRTPTTSAKWPWLIRLDRAKAYWAYKHDNTE